MQNKTVFVLGLAVLSIILISVFFALKNTPSEPTPPKEEEEPIAEDSFQYKDLVRVSQPLFNQTITSPLYVSGEARGTWFFEASFPIRLENEQGEAIATYFAQTSLDWMTKEYVPFSSYLEFPMPSAGTAGTLVITKDNPSGIPEFNDEFRIPVRFGELPQDTVELQIHFSIFDPDTCERTLAVTRRVPRTQAVAHAALQELLKGPTQLEAQNQNLFTSLNPGVELQNITIENGVAHADFSERLDFQVGGSCRVQAIRSQIEHTLLEFATVENVIISIDGREDDILQP